MYTRQATLRDWVRIEKYNMKIPYLLVFLAWLFLFNVNVHGFISLTRKQHKMMSKEWQSRKSTSPINPVRSKLFKFDSYFEKLQSTSETKASDSSLSIEEVWKKKLDWESIRSSPRDGSSTSNGLTKGWLGFGGWLGVVGWVVGPQYFRVIP